MTDDEVRALNLRIAERDGQLVASQAEVARLRAALEFGLTDGGHAEGCVGAPYRVPCRCGREEFVEMAHNALAADPGQATARVQAIVQRAKDLIDNPPDMDKHDSRAWAICDVGRYEALVDAVEALATPGKGEEEP